MHKRKIRNYFYLAFAVLLIVGLVLLPIFYFEWSDQTLLSQTHEMGTMNYELSSDVENITMVQRLHNILNSFYSDNISESQTIFIQDLNNASGDFDIDVEEDTRQSECITFQIHELRSYKDIAQIMLKDYSKLNGKIKDSIDWMQNNLDSVIYCSFTSQDEVFSCKYDTETGKIIMLSISSNEKISISEENKQKIYQEFLSYLNLLIVGDWYYNGDRMISEKAHLALSLTENKNKWTLEFEAY